MWPGKGGAGVKVTRCGEVGAVGARKWGARVRVTGRGWVRAEDAGLGGSDAKSLGSGVGERDIAGLAVEAGWVLCRLVSTLRATLESKVKDLTLICRFTVQPGC